VTGRASEETEGRSGGVADIFSVVTVEEMSADRSPSGGSEVTCSVPGLRGGGWTAGGSVPGGHSDQIGDDCSASYTRNRPATRPSSSATADPDIAMSVDGLPLLS
jgi:hypothetical protein